MATKQQKSEFKVYRYWPVEYRSIAWVKAATADEAARLALEDDDYSDSESCDGSDGPIEVGQVMDDLRSADVDFLTIGQYLQPTPKHARIDRFVTPEEFESYRTMALAKGFLLVSASPLTRSSYHADEDFQRLKAARAARLAR